MSPAETIEPTSATAAHLGALGAECEIERCAGCGRALLGGAPCGCAGTQSRTGRLRLSLVEALDGDLPAPGASPVGRLRVRGEVIA